MLHEVFQRPSKIIHKLIENGYDAYYVGGSIRDMLLGREIGDVDIATSAKPEEVMKLFPSTIPVGLQHGTVIVVLDQIPYEVTTFRTDTEYVDFRRPKEVFFIHSLEEDLRRRDFTMNAIAMDLNGHLIDPFHGQAAILQKTIQTVGNPLERFKEDALRMLRAIRFHSQLSFQIEKETQEGIKQYAHLLKHISIERITNEIEKIIIGTSCHSAMHFIYETGLFEHILNLSKYQNGLKIWKQKNTALLQTREELWAFLCLQLEIDHIQQFLKDWKLPNKIIENASKIVLAYKKLSVEGWNNELIYQIGKELAFSTERIYSILQDLLISNQLNKCERIYNALPIKSKSELHITGNDLMEWSNKPPGPWMKETLSRIENEIVNGRVINEKDSIKEWLFSCNLL